MFKFKTNKYFLIYFLMTLIFIFHEVKSQSNKKTLDSLNSKLKSAKSDTNKVNILNQISEGLLRINPELSRKYSIDALNLSQDIVWEKGKANSLVRIGNSYYLTNDIPNAQKFYQRALELFEKNNILSGVATATGNLGLVYAEQSLVSKADSCYNIALKIGQKINDKKIIQRNYSNLGVLYANIGDFKNSLNYYFKSIDEAIETKDNNGLAISYSNVGNIYNRKKSYNKAIEYYKKAMDLNLSNKNNIALAYNYFNIAVTYKDLNNYPKSLYFHDLNLKLQEVIKDTSFIVDIKLEYANIEYTLSNYNKALKIYDDIKDFILMRDIKNEKFKFYLSVTNVYLSKFKTSIKEKSIEDKDMSRNKEILLAKENFELAKSFLDTNYLNIDYVNFYLAETNIERTFNNYKKAFKSYQKYVELKDSLNNIKNNEIVYEFEHKLELAEKNREIKLNQLKLENSKKNQLLTYIALGLVTILLLTFILLFNKIKKLNKKLEIKNIEISDSNQAKDKLFSIIAHDLINPISAFKSVTQTLSNDFVSISQKEQFEYLELMTASSEGILEMLKNLLDWSRFQRGLINYTFDNISVTNVINQYFSIFDLVAKEKNIKLINIATTNSIIYADENLFQTIFRNILSNAIKFSNFGGIIEVNVIENIEYNNKTYTEISIKDNGVGISKENLATLNEGKNHISMFGTKNEKGTGLGLVLCKDYLNVLKGKMIIESEINKGTNIRILIPKAN